MQWDERFLSTSRGQVLLALRRGPRTVDELARALQLTRNAIRSHLSILERDGLVQHAGNRAPARSLKRGIRSTETELMSIKLHFVRQEPEADDAISCFRPESFVTNTVATFSASN